ncbi:DUF2061 domain-containing protein [Aliisedimentitalea scapharcae]|uniref:DUF2061 domain-containing protein n=1 Tax=Aliisedimentitalea scapharcae TaxID=1524259 RepID=A0ABZ2XY99_9RHOB|nr:DUF2061 domain-containing protein [Rhodobacteraceae bacterium M382]
MESGLRSMVKAVIWNVMGLLTMTIVGFLATGSVAAGGVMAVVNTAIGFGMYLFYERVWARIGWGRRHV